MAAMAQARSLFPGDGCDGAASGDMDVSMCLMLVLGFWGAAGRGAVDVDQGWWAVWRAIGGAGAEGGAGTS